MEEMIRDHVIAGHRLVMELIARLVPASVVAQLSDGIYGVMNGLVRCYELERDPLWRSWPNPNLN
jgi:hypothetical protein